MFLCVLLSVGGCGGRTVSHTGPGAYDWPSFRGEPGLSGYTDTPLPEKPVLLWSYASDARTVSSPVVRQGVTYWADRRGTLRGVNLAGEPVFEYALHTAVEATPLISDSTLFIGRIDGCLSAISLTTSELLWQFECQGQISAPPARMNYRGRPAVVFGSYDHYLYCVDALSGEEINRFESGYYLNGAVAIRDQYALFGGCDTWLRMIDCRTGILVDSLQLNDYIPASPALSGDELYIGDHAGNIYCCCLEAGRIAHHRKIVTAGEGEGGFVSVPAVSNRALFYLSDNRQLYCLDRQEGKQLWSYGLKGTPGESSPVVCRNRVLVCTKTGIISLLDARDGSLLWEYDTGEQIVGSPAVIRDHFLVLTAKGTLFCFGKSR